jgi:glycerol-1-phosphate dehydrogenase [NAD(P)+]
VKQQKPDREKMLAHAAAFDYDKWEAQVKRIFGKAADEIIRVEGKVHKNDPDRLAKRIDALCENWDEILKIIDEELPAYDELYGAMKGTGMPVEPKDLDICDEDVVNAYLGARDIRDKYLSCSFLWDMGLEMDAAAYLKSTL